MNRHFEQVQSDLNKVHIFREASQDASEDGSLTMGDVSDSDDDASLKPVHSHSGPVVSEKELRIMRKVMKKWWRLAGLKGMPAVCAEEGEEFQVNWTRVTYFLTKFQLSY